MSKKPAAAKLQTSATPQLTAEEQRKAGMGGSYVYDPKTGTTALEHRTEGGSVSNKKPLEVLEEDQAPAPAVGASEAAEG